MKRFIVLIALMAFANTANAAFLDFAGYGRPNRNDAVSAIANGPLSGDIGLNISKGTDTPLLNGTEVGLNNAHFIFTTGNYIGNGTYDDEGGSVKLFENNELILQGDIDGPTTLVKVGEGNFKVIGSGFHAVLGETLRERYGLVNLPTFVEGGFSILFSSNSQVGNAFTSYNVLSTNLGVDVTPQSGAVPEPASLAMTGIGLGGVGLAIRRRKKPIRLSTGGDEEENDGGVEVIGEDDDIDEEAEELDSDDDDDCACDDEE